MNCPNCGAQVDMDDSREFGYCSICGSKVMVDRMIVEHKGSVKIDQSDKVKNALIVARRARENNDIENAKRNYDIVLAEEPNNWEAYFYSTILSACGIKNAEIGSAITMVNNCFYSTKDIIDDAIIDSEDNFKATKEIALVAANKLCDLYISTHVFLMGITSSSLMWDTGIRWEVNAEDLIVKLINHIDCLSKVDQRYRGVATNLYKVMLYRIEVTNHERILAIANRIREDEPDYKNEKENKSTGSGGCYVATCVYGSYDCPQVWTLRRYRDDTLAATWYGRAFIHTYYAVSPTLVKWFGHTKWFKKMWQGKLDRMVKRLNDDGVADTPYADKKW